MTEVRTKSYVANDGRVFTGENAHQLCEKYEADTVKMIENRLANEHLASIYRDASTDDYYIHVHKQEGVSLVNDWLAFKAITILYEHKYAILPENSVGNTVRIQSDPNRCGWYKPVLLSHTTTALYNRIKALVDIDSKLKYRSGVQSDLT